MLSIKKSVLFVMMLSSCCEVWGGGVTPTCPTVDKVVEKAKEACDKAIQAAPNRRKKLTTEGFSWIKGTTKNKCRSKAIDQQKAAEKETDNTKKLKKYQACYVLAKIAVHDNSADENLLYEVKQCGHYDHDAIASIQISKPKQYIATLTYNVYKAKKYNNEVPSKTLTISLDHAIECRHNNSTTQIFDSNLLFTKTRVHEEKNPLIRSRSNSIASTDSNVTLSDDCEIAVTTQNGTTCLASEQHSPGNNPSESTLEEPGSPKSIAVVDVSSASNQKGSLPSGILSAIQTGKSGLKTTQPNSNQATKSTSISLETQQILARRDKIAGGKEEDDDEPEDTRDSLFGPFSSDVKVSKPPVKTHTQHSVGGIISPNFPMLSKAPAQKTVDQLQSDLANVKNRLNSATAEEHKFSLELIDIKKNLENASLIAAQKGELIIQETKAQTNKIAAAKKKSDVQREYDDIQAEIAKLQLTDEEEWK